MSQAASNRLLIATFHFLVGPCSCKNRISSIRSLQPANHFLSETWWLCKFQLCSLCQHETKNWAQWGINPVGTWAITIIVQPVSGKSNEGVPEKRLNIILYPDKTHFHKTPLQNGYDNLKLFFDNSKRLQQTCNYENEN